MQTFCLQAAIVTGCLLAGCTRQPKGTASAMQTSSGAAILLTAAQRGGSRALVSEEGADFDLALRNSGSGQQTLQSLENDFTPTYKIFDSAGRELGEYTSRQRTVRVVGDIGTAEFGPPDQVTLGPGESANSWLGLWELRDPLPPGEYSFQAQHEATPGAAGLQSNRVVFEIRPAHVEGVAVAMDAPARANSVMAWLARPEKSAGLRLLIRQSGFPSHKSVQVGGTANGEFSEGSRVGLAAMPMDARFSPINWAAVVSRNRLQLIQHNMGISYWRAPVITLPAADAVPVPRFPNRQYAVFLATGNTQAGPALMGVVMKNGDTSATPWTIRLPAAAVHSACAFAMGGAITILYSSDDGQTTRLHRLSVLEGGVVSEQDAVIHESTTEILAVSADIRVGQPASFIVAEADRVNHNRLGLIKVALNGGVLSTGLREFSGWPMITASPGASRPARATSVAFDADAAGMPWLAMIAENGEFVGGRLDGNLHALRENQPQRCSWPQVVGLVDSMTLSCFLDNGMLYHYRTGPDDQ